MLKNEKRLLLVATIFSVLSLLLWLLLPAAAGNFGNLTVYNYYYFTALTFGKKTFGLGFNILNLIPLVTLIGSITLNILNYLDIDVFKTRKTDINIAALLSLISAGGFLSVIQFTSFANNFADNSGVSLGLGAILTATLSILSASVIFLSKIFKQTI